MPIEAVRCKTVRIDIRARNAMDNGEHLYSADPVNGAAL